MNELDQLLQTLRAPEPRLSEISRWKAAVKQVRKRPSSRWIELVAAMLIGVLIGGAVFNPSTDEENFDKYATIERVITKIE